MPLRVLSVASEIYPLIKTGGLADVAGALPLALRHEDIDVRTLVPGYPAVMHRLATRSRCIASTTCSAATRGCWRPPPWRDWNCWYWMRRICTTVRAIRTGAHPGDDWPDNPQRFAALSRVAADIGLGPCPPSSPTSCTPMTGRRAWCRPTCTMPAAGGPAP